MCSLQQFLIFFFGIGFVFVNSLSVSNGKSRKSRAVNTRKNTLPLDLSTELNPKTKQPKLDGFQRAKAFNNCPVRHHAPYFDIYPLVSTEKNAVYFLESKTASSTFRETLQPPNPHSWPKWPVENNTNFTRFTFVRDPVSRFISSFFEAHRKCSKGVEKNLMNEDPANETSRARVMGWFEEYVLKLERREHGCWGTHGHTPQRWRLPKPKVYPMDFIGDLSVTDADWKDLVAYQEQKFNVNLGGLHTVRRSARTKTLLLNASLVPGKLVKKLCRIFREDYCCFKLPIPSACNLKCGF